MAMIQDYLNNILKAVYGKDVRQSIHDAIAAINNDTVSNIDSFKSTVSANIAGIKQITSNTAEKQEELEETYKKQIANMTNDNPSLSEVVDARGKYGTLGDRLDDEERQFAETKFRFISKGQMREPVRSFQGWSHCIKYDQNLEKIVGFVISGNRSHSNGPPYYRVEIDPNTGLMSEYTEVILYESDGQAVYNDEKNCGYIGSFVIMPDGTYMIIDYYQRIFLSQDYGYTFTYQRQLALNGRNTYNNDFPFGATILSNGRIIAGNGGNSVKETYYSDDAGVTWSVVPMTTDTGTNPFEPCFIEIGGGRVLQIARKSMNAVSGSTNWAIKEPACYSVSEDYGETWTRFTSSKTLTDMTACNGQAVVIDGFVHFVYCSRYRNTEDNTGGKHYGAMYYSYAKLEDAYADNWNTPEQIEFGHWRDDATRVCDIGYPSLMTDGKGNLIAIYYDSAENSADVDSANWRMLAGNHYVQPSPISSAGGSKTTAYPSQIVDDMVKERYADLIYKINDLMLKNGDIPENTYLDGTYPVTKDLIAWFDAGKQSNWSGNVCASKVPTELVCNAATVINCNLYPSSTEPSDFKDNCSNVGLVVSEMDLSNYDSITVEAVLAINTNQNIIGIGKKNANSLISRINNFDGAYLQYVYFHLCYVIKADAVVLYINGEKKDTLSYEGNLMEEANAICVSPASKQYVGNLLIYGRELAADEIKNNYKYSCMKTPIGRNAWE